MNLLDNEQTIKAFGIYVRRARKQKKLNQTQTAEMLEITQSYYSLIERGEREIGMPLALNICRVLDLDFNTFIQSLTMKKPRVKRPDMKNSTPE